MSGPRFDAAVFALDLSGPVVERAGLPLWREHGVRLAAVGGGAGTAGGTAHATPFEVHVANGDPETLLLEALRRLGARPEAGALLTDDPAFAAAGRAAGFGLVVGVGRGGAAGALRDRGADLVVEGLAAASFAHIDAWFEHADERRPSALADFGAIAVRLRGRRAPVFLDFDGTLSPIVDRPDDAVLAPGMGEALRRLARVRPVVVVSGRGREDVAARVGLPDLVYAGSHGFDIAGPAGLRHEVDPGLRTSMAAAFRTLSEAACGIAGAIVEDKVYSVSVHYRMARGSDVGRLEALVDGVVAADPRLRKGTGKKVFEVRPQLEWDKGRALLWILDALGFGGPDVGAVYLGDDVTDEDAFAVLGPEGIGILVSETPRKTGARWWLRDPAEVREFLVRLARIADAP